MHSGSSESSIRRPSMPSRSCWRMPHARLPTTPSCFHMASVTVSPNPSRKEFCTTRLEVPMTDHRPMDALEDLAAVADDPEVPDPAFTAGLLEELVGDLDPEHRLGGPQF